MILARPLGIEIDQHVIHDDWERSAAARKLGGQAQANAGAARNSPKPNAEHSRSSRTMEAKTMSLDPAPGNAIENGEEHDCNPVIKLPESAIFSYYRDDNEETGGMQVKWSVRVASGAEARQMDARQAEAIRELLTWARRHHRI